MSNIVEKKKDQLRRLIITQNDLSQAKAFLAYIKRSGLLEPNGSQDRLIRLALDTAMLIAYSRPFKSGKRSQSSVPSTITGNYMNVLTEEEKELHRHLLDRRSAEYAHSDAEAYNVKIFMTDAPELPFDFMIHEFRNPHIPIPREQMEKIEVMIDKLYAFALEKSRKLTEELSSAD